MDMHEKEFNTIVSKSLNLKGYGFKIPDTFVSGTYNRSKSPCDGIGFYNHKFVCWESKYLNEPKSFPFDRLEDHQIKALIDFYENIDCYSLFLIGVNFGRGDNRVFYWMNGDLYKINERKNNKDNIYKKEFLSLDNYIKIKRGVIDFDEILV